MFGKKKETPKKSIIPNSNSNALNSLVKGTIVEGTVHSESDIRVDGVIKGKLTCLAKVIVGPSGQIEGEVKCVNAVIEGKFKGILTVDELLSVKENAEVVGDITTNKLVVQAGAIFSVACKMGSNTYTAPLNGKDEIVSVKKVVKNVGEKAFE